MVQQQQDMNDAIALCMTKAAFDDEINLMKSNFRKELDLIHEDLAKKDQNEIELQLQINSLKDENNILRETVNNITNDYKKADELIITSVNELKEEHYELETLMN